MVEPEEKENREGERIDGQDGEKNLELKGEIYGKSGSDHQV